MTLPHSAKLPTNRQNSCAAGAALQNVFCRLLGCCVWIYLFSVCAVWLLIAVAGDRWWFATVILFAPRWLYALPLIALLPLVAFVRRHHVFVLLLAGALCAGPIAGCSVPTGLPAFAARPFLRVLTCNVENWTGETGPALKELIQKTRPDIVAIQECGVLMPPIWPAGWEVRRSGGLLIASPHPLSDAGTDTYRLQRTHAGHIEVLGCLVRSTVGEVRFCNVHLPSPRRGLEPLLDRWTVVRPSESPRLEAITDFRHEQSRIVSDRVANQYGADLVAGDFNMPVDSYIYRRYWSGLRNAFNMVGWGYGYTKRSEIRGLRYGLRIDHVLTGTNWRPIRCWVENSVGSDHLPVVADLVPRK